MHTDTPSNSSEEKEHQGLASWLQVPSRAVSVVEHPCIIKNVDKGIISLGGAAKLSKALRSKPVPTKDTGQEDTPDAPDLTLPAFISASLRPDDPYAKRILSTPVTTNNLLLKITVPKRTGRRRKRGSSGPFLTADEIRFERNGTSATTKDTSGPGNPYVDPRIVYQSVRDNASYTVHPVGVIDESHRFRSLPDIQYTASRDQTMIDIKNHLLPLRYSQLKKFKPNTVPGADLSKGIGVSAEFLQMPVAYNYKYQQNPHIKYVGESREEVNLYRRIASDGYAFVHPSADSVPTGPKPHVPPEYTLTPYVQGLIAKIRAELLRRPIITRHIIFNALGWDKRDRIREAAVYCGYFFETGPWREALIAWGIDPRKDPMFRQYQTISFQSYIKSGSARHWQAYDKHLRDLAAMEPEELATQHTFDGVNVSHTGNLFQFCDISDPIVRKILDTDDIRTTCAPTFQGWYHVGTWAKATVIMKDKMNTIVGGETPDDMLYERILTWPEIWDDKEIFQTYRLEIFDKELRRKNAREHLLMSTVRSAARNPKWAFERLKTQEEGGREGAVAENNEVDAAEEEEVPEDLTEIPDTADAIMREGGDDESDSESGDEFDDGEDEEEAEYEEDNFESQVDVDGVVESGGKSRPFSGLYTGK